MLLLRVSGSCYTARVLVHSWASPDSILCFLLHLCVCAGLRAAALSEWLAVARKDIAKMGRNTYRKTTDNPTWSARYCLVQYTQSTYFYLAPYRKTIQHILVHPLHSSHSSTHNLFISISSHIERGCNIIWSTHSTHVTPVHWIYLSF